MNRYIRRRRLTIVHRNAAEEKTVAVQYFQLMSAPEGAVAVICRAIWGMMRW